MGCRGGSEIAVEIRAERSNPRVGPGTNCRGSISNSGGFPKHLADLACFWLALSQRFKGLWKGDGDPNVGL